MNKNILKGLVAVGALTASSSSFALGLSAAGAAEIATLIPDLVVMGTAVLTACVTMFSFKMIKKML